MKASHRPGAAIAAGLAFLLPSLGLSSAALAGTGEQPAAAGGCSSGAHTLSHLGDHVYPDTGNGGYVSVHTDVHLVYDATRNRFLPGNHVDLTDRATQCLTDFSLDFERRSTANTAAGPDLRIISVTVNGQPATFRFVQPTYPGDPHGQNDPSPAAHEASQVNPVGGPAHNPLPPACSPELKSVSASKRNSQNGEQCPANKLVITPSAPVSDGSTFIVAVAYAGRTVLANGVLISRTRHSPDAGFPHGSVTWHWHSAAPVASYLVEDSVGRYTLTERTADNGVKYYRAQASSLSAARQKRNLAIMKKQEDITDFESLFNGTYPFTSDGVVVGRPSASFEEEMQTMITFAGGQIDTDVLYHENMHQWWGDNVTEASYNLTFFKEGLATLGEFLFAARTAETAAGGPFSRAGQRAFDRSLVRQFDSIYQQKGTFWTAAPSNPTPFVLFSSPPTYDRPGTAYIALRQILGKTNFAKALQQIQRQYGGGSITEPQLEAGFRQWLPNPSAACRTRLGQFFTQWFDTAYPRGGGAHRPQITGPGLAGPGFYGKGGCVR